MEVYEVIEEGMELTDTPKSLGKFSRLENAKKEIRIRLLSFRELGYTYEFAADHHFIRNNNGDTVKMIRLRTVSIE